MSTLKIRYLFIILLVGGSIGVFISVPLLGMLDSGVSHGFRVMISVIFLLYICITLLYREDELKTRSIKDLQQDVTHLRIESERQKLLNTQLHAAMEGKCVVIAIDDMTTSIMAVSDEGRKKLINNPSIRAVRDITFGTSASDDTFTINDVRPGDLVVLWLSKWGNFSPGHSHLHITGKMETLGVHYHHSHLG